MKAPIVNLIPLFSILLFSACEKDSEPVQNNTITPLSAYTQLKVGNYWIYERFSVDTNWVESPTGVYDSCYIEKDTLINGKNYFKMMRPDRISPPNMVVTFWRDSSDYMVDQTGLKIFSSTDFTSVFQSIYLLMGQGPDTLLHKETKMADINMLISTPAGQFISLNAKESYYFYIPISPWWHNNQYKSLRFTANVGIIAETLPFYAAEMTKPERKLVRYHLN